MKKVLKWLAIIVGGVIGLLIIAVVVLNVIAGSRLNRTFEVAVQPVAIPSDEAAVERGRHLVMDISGCGGCHGPDFGGDAVIDEAPIGLVYAPNLTAGQGGIGDSYSDEDWTRALRHGVGPDSKPLVLMPSHYFRRYSDEDLGAIVAFVKSAPAVDRESRDTALSATGRIIFAIGGLGPLPAEQIDHEAPPPAAPEPGVTVEYGELLSYVAACGDCHGPDLSGGAPPAPAGPNLTPSGTVGDWSEADFITTIRTGVRPNGVPLSPEMPWMAYANMSDEELQALFLYLQSLPPAAAE